MYGSPTRTRTRDQLINSQSLYQLSYRGIGWHLSGARRDFGPATPLSQAATALFKRRTASFSVGNEHANDSRK